ncbi:halocyanin domain-containing protein [Haloarcula salina]|uniref:halocyanin domain-containing protein n=1 Tax=Haloarcula salina TaxID=1429914 RepID=UPI003C6F9CC3
MTSDLDRRTFVRGTAILTGVGLLAGCSGGDGGSGGGGGDGGSGDGSDGGSGDGGGGETAESSQEVSEYVGASSNYDGSTVVMTGQDEVSVAVGADGNGGAFAFGPPAVKVSTGTTVVWEWTGDGGAHNVVSQGDGPLDSGSAVTEAGTTYEYTFDEAGTYRYYCVPHESLGMKAAVVVE